MDVIVTIVEYKRYLKSSGYAASSVEAYSRYLDLFKNYLLENSITDLRKVTEKVIEAYQAKLAKENIAIESKALKIRPVKRLFEYLIKDNRLLINPTEKIVETCRKNHKIGYVLTTDEMRKILEQPNLSVKAQIRDRALFEVMYSTGIRINELVSLEVYHVDLKNRVLYIRKGKGRKQRVVPIGKNAVRFLKEYLNKIRPHYAKKNPKERKLFLNHSGLSLSRGSIQAALRNYRIAAGIKKPVSPHAIRRTCATHMLQNGADIRYLQKLLGHAHLRTTQFYTKIRPIDIKSTHDKTHPGQSL